MLGVGRDGPRGGDTGEAAGRDRGAPVGRVAPDERAAWVLLNEAEGVGPVSFGRLLEAFGTARAVLLASVEPGATGRLVAATATVDRSPSLTPAGARSIAELATSPDRVLAPVRRAGVWPLVLADEEFPARLRRIELPPPVLFVAGRVAALDRARSVAVVGTRRPTEAGRRTAARIAEAVAHLGATVVSGLAVGIDAAAHRACTGARLPTVAVIGGGHGRLYPAGHRALVAQIVRDGGAVVSEFAPDTIPSQGTFPRRNRIISGLADATVVVEAGARSGALTTAAWALEQARDLYIVPGRLDDPTVAGSLAFLREAGPEARVVAGIAELLDDLGLRTGAGVVAAGSHVASRPAWPTAAIPDVERAVAEAIDAGSSSVDELVAATGLGGATILGALTALEVRGLVTEAFGRYRVAGMHAATGCRRSRGAPGARRRRGVTGGGRERPTDGRAA